MEFEKKSNGITDDEEDDEPLILPGFRFSPTDEELVEFYLKRKVEDKPTRIELIKHIDIYKYEPWDLPMAGEKEMYLFCKRGRKYKNSTRPNRVTRCGFWKATGIDKQVHASHDQCIGLKKTLVYYVGSARKGNKTDWMMHEFRLPPSTKIAINLEQTEIWTVCRIFKREVSGKKNGWDNKNTPCSKRNEALDRSCHDKTIRCSSWESDIKKGDIKTKRVNNGDETVPYGVRNTKLLADSSLITSVSLISSSFGFGDGIGTWDELRPMVDFVFRKHNHNHNHNHDHDPFQE